MNDRSHGPFPLNRSELSMLLALLENEPATSKLLAVALKNSFDQKKGLNMLRLLGLVDRHMANYTRGKPPYLYTLTEGGRIVANLMRVSTQLIRDSKELKGRRQINSHLETEHDRR